MSGEEPFSYPRAGMRGDSDAATFVEVLALELLAQGLPVDQLGPTLVKAFARVYRRLPTAGPGIEKSQVPMLYSLLGSGTPPLKMSKEDSAYQEAPVGKQRCGNCSSSYQNLADGNLVCSQICGQIGKTSWCRLFNLDRR